MVDTNQVVQTVIRVGEKFFIARRSRDEKWEFIGGKVREDESLREASIREITEETGVNLEDCIDNFESGESYQSRDNEKYNLNPVLVEVGEEFEAELSEEHTEYEWIDLKDFYQYDTLGQYQALENLDIVNGDVALAAARKGIMYLMLERSGENSSSGKWTFPGGKIEANESKREAVLRELREETQLEGEVVEAGDPYISEGELGYWRVYPFLVSLEDGEPVLDCEHSDFIWAQPPGLKSIDTLGNLKSLEKLGVLNG